MEKRTMNLEIRSADIENRKIVGYAATFEESYTLLRDRWGEKFYERICAGAFAKSLRENEAFMLVNHNWNQVVGRTGANLILTEDETGLRFELDVPNTTDGNDLLENVKLGLIQGCSFGFVIEKEKTRWDDKWNFYRDIEEVKLNEITATPIPAYKSTSIEARNAEGCEMSIRELRASEQEKNQLNQDEDQKSENLNANERTAQLLSSFFEAFQK